MQKRGVFRQISKHVTVHDFLLSLAFELLMSLRSENQVPQMGSQKGRLPLCYAGAFLKYINRTQSTICKYLTFITQVVYHCYLQVNKLPQNYCISKAHYVLPQQSQPKGQLFKLRRTITMVTVMRISRRTHFRGLITH